jgi:ribosomal protein S18 acetylase RimI-like enzyme
MAVSNTMPTVMLSFRNATHDDIPALIALVTAAYRGDASRQGWTTEADLLGGQRIDAQMLRADLDAPGSVILLATDSGDEDRPRLVACANIATQTSDDGIATAYFGMFSVDPDLVLAEAERIAHDTLCCARMRMTVIDSREELIAYYERRGYVRTGISKPFPYGDPRYGLPKRDDLQFEILEKSLEMPP